MKKTMILFTLLLSGQYLLGMEGNLSTAPFEIDKIFKKAWIGTVEQYKVDIVCRLLDSFLENDSEFVSDYLNQTIEYYKRNNLKKNLSYIENHFQEYLKEQSNIKFFFACIKKAQDHMDNQKFDSALKIYKQADAISTDALEKNSLTKDVKNGIKIQIAQLYEQLGETQKAVEIYKEKHLNINAVKRLLELDPESFTLKSLIAFVKIKIDNQEFDKEYETAYSLIKKSPNRYPELIWNQVD